MLHLRITAPSDLTAAVVEILDADPAVSSLVKLPAAAIWVSGRRVRVVDRLRKSW